MGDLFALRQRVVTTGNINFDDPVERKRTVMSHARRGPKLCAILIALALHGSATLALVAETHHVPRHVMDVPVTLQLMPASGVSHSTAAQAAPPPIAKTVPQRVASPQMPLHAAPAMPATTKPPLPTAKPAPRRASPSRRPVASPRTHSLSPPAAAAHSQASAPGKQTAPTARPVPLAAPSSASSPATVNLSWQSQLDAWLEAHKQYPDAAREYGQEGAATVRFTVARDGHVINVALLNGSGVEQLDSAAIRMLQDADVPAFPASMRQAEMTITVRINYALDDDQSAD